MVRLQIGQENHTSIPGRSKICLFSKTSKFGPEPTQPPIKLALKALSPDVKRPGRDDDRSPPYNAKFNNEWHYTSTPPLALMAFKDQFHFNELKKQLVSSIQWMSPKVSVFQNNPAPIHSKSILELLVNALLLCSNGHNLLL